MLPRIIIITLLLSLSCAGQMFYPESAHVNLYFPQLADGGNQTQSWQTWFIFFNPDKERSAGVYLQLFNNDGGPLPLDLGDGPKSSMVFTVPPAGRVTLRSRIASQTVTTGWAMALTTLPVQATVFFRLIEQGVPKADYAAPAALPAMQHWSVANRNLGIALANIYSIPLTVKVKAVHQNGNVLGMANVSLSGLGHWSGNLWSLFPSLPSDFLGSVEIYTESPMLGVPPPLVVAWTLNEDSNLLSTLPSGRLSWPISHVDRIHLVYYRVLGAARRLEPLVFSSPLNLSVRTEPIVNAYARSGTEVGIYVGLSELISDSESELAWVIAHELGHIYQQRTGLRVHYLTNPEFDADIWGTIISLVAGYDPYAAAGALAKLAMATGRAGLTDQFEDQLAADAHKSFNTRIDTVYDALTIGCVYPGASTFCTLYKSLIHPHLPPSAPLEEPVPAAAVDRP